MDRAIYESLKGQNDSYILPFLQMKGEEERMLRREVAKIDECGIRALCPEPRRYPYFAEEDWWRDFGIVLDEARKRGLTVWIPAGNRIPASSVGELPPKEYLAAGSFDVSGPLVRGTLDISSVMGRAREGGWEDGELMLVEAVRMPKDDTLSVEVAVDGSSNRIVLTDMVHDGRAVCDFPEGVWRVFVIYTVKRHETDGTVNPLDPSSMDVLIRTVCEAHLGRYGADFGRTVAGFCQSGLERGEPSGALPAPKDSALLLPWTGELCLSLDGRLGPRWREQLPLLYFPSEDARQTAAVRYAYMDAVSLLKAKHGSERLGRWCREHGLGYFGRTAGDLFEYGRPGKKSEHFFREMRGQTMAGIHTTDGLFSRYALTKMGASSALMEPDKEGRLICGLFTGCGYGFGVRDMKRAVDYRVAQGVNFLAPHAFSAAEYPDGDCPPHFYCGGRNAEFPYFARLMRYASRLCHIFSGGRWIPEVALYYHGELGWMDDCMRDQLPAGKLKEGYIDYAIVPSDALMDAAGCGEGRYPVSVENHRLVLNGVPVKVLVVPGTRYADPGLLHFLETFPDVKTIFVDAAPEGLEGAEVVALDQLVPKLKSLGVIGARSDVSGPATFYHYVKDSGDLWMVFNESRTDAISGNLLVRLLSEEQKVWRYDVRKNRVYRVEQLLARGFDEPRMLSTLQLDPYESAVFFTATEEEAAHLCGREDLRELWPRKKKDISGGWRVEVADAWEEPEFRPLEEAAGMAGASGAGITSADGKLVPVSDVLPYFTGVMRYSRDVELASPEHRRYCVEVEHLYEAARLFVNGEEADCRICPPYHFDLGGLFREGTNRIEIEVVPTPLRDVLYRGVGRGTRKACLAEPTGMFGSVVLAEYSTQP